MVPPQRWDPARQAPSTTLRLRKEAPTHALFLAAPFPRGEKPTGPRNACPHSLEPAAWAHLGHLTRHLAAGTPLIQGVTGGQRFSGGYGQCWSPVLGIYSHPTKDPSSGRWYKGWEEKGVVGFPGTTMPQSQIQDLNLAF